MSWILGFVSRQPRWRILLLGVFSVALLGVLDYLTGYEISFSNSYLLPVAMVAWSVGPRAGVVISLTAAASWLIAELLAGPSGSFVVTIDASSGELVFVNRVGEAE